MKSYVDRGLSRALLTPLTLADRRPDSAASACGQFDTASCSMQRFDRLPPAIELPGLCTDVLVGHLAGPFFAEAEDPDGRDERRWISPGQVGVTPVGQPVHRRFKGRPDVVLIHLDPTRLRATAEDVFGCDPARVHLVPKLAESDEVADRLIRMLLVEAERPLAGTSLTVDALVCALSVHALRFHSNLSPPRPTASATLPSGRLRRVCDFMRANLDEPVSLAQLANVAGLSASQLTRAFRDATGETPHRYLVNLRVERACDLLGRTDLPFVEVALQCGFAQASHFATAFRKAKGMTPRDWRQSRRA